MRKALLLGIIFVTTAIIMITGCGKSEKPKIPGEDWGEAVKGLAMRLTGTTNVEADGIFEVTALLKNVSKDPIELKDATPECFACLFSIVDQNGLNIQWIPNTTPAITATAIPPRTLNPDETYRISKRLDKEGSFMPPLKAGMKLTISASYEVNLTGGLANTWTGKITSNPISVSIIDNTWGEPVNGLHCYLARVPDTIAVNEPMLLEVIIENTDPLKPVLLHNTSDNKKKPQIDIEIIDESMKPVFKSRRISSGSIDYITLNPGEKIHAVVIPFSADISKQLNILNIKKLGYQKASAADKKMKLSGIPSGRYYITAYYNHVAEKGKTYSKTWSKGWTGSIKSNTVLTNLTGGVSAPILTTSESFILSVEIKPKSGKTKTIKQTTALEDIRKSLADLKPLKKPSKAKGIGTITVVSDNSTTIYNYSSTYLENKDTPGVQYQIPSSLKKYIPK